MAEHNSFIDTFAERWHNCYVEILAEIARLDTPEYKYSEDFYYLATAIGEDPIDMKRVDAAKASLTKRRTAFGSTPLKETIGNFVACCSQLYKKPEEARAYLKKMGWLPKKEQFRRAAPNPKPHPFDQVRPTPNPIPNPRPRPTPNPVNPPRPPRPPKPNDYNNQNNPRPFDYEEGPSFFERVDFWFETIRYYLDVWLEWVSQYAETVFYILASIIAAVVVILTFVSGHWIVAIIEILVCLWIGMTALAIGGVIAKAVLKGILYGLKIVFYRWWSFLIIIALCVGLPTFKAVQEKQKDKEFKSYIEKALSAVEEERYVDARINMEKAAEYDTPKSSELKAKAEEMTKQAVKKAAALKKQIPQDLKKLKNQKTSKTGFADEIDAIQEKIDQLRGNERPSPKAEEFQKQLDELKVKKLK